MLTILAFIVTIGIIVTIHEYGHFQVARWCGVKVLRFSIGFGKPLWRKSAGADNTEFVLAAIPLGGYVKMLDEHELKAEKEAAESDENVSNQAQTHYSEADLARAFNRQSVYKRIAIVLAGPMANLLLAILIYWALMMQGVVGMQPIVGNVYEGSIAAQAKFSSGELIQAIDGEKVDTWTDASWTLLNAAFDNKTVEVSTVDNSKQQHLRTLNLNGLGKDAEADILKKVGLEVFRPDIDPVIEQVIAESAAFEAGLMPGDKVISIDGVKTITWNAVVNIIKTSPEQSLQLKIERQGAIVEVVVKPQAVVESDIKVGKLGVAVKFDQSKLGPFLIKQHYSVIDSLGLAVSKTWTTSIFSLKMMWYMITGKTSWKGISGPVTIASYAGQSAGLGIKAFLGFIALVSISIGVLNLLPIPILDGGHLMYYVAEIIKGSAVTEQTMLLGQKIGFGLLGLLMTLAIFNDINRIVAG
ncbi:MAG: RIP metalloprotease RseP [Methylophilaceae bacterium]